MKVKPSKLKSVTNYIQVYLHQAEHYLIDFSLGINNSATLGKTKSFHINLQSIMLLKASFARNSILILFLNIQLSMITLGNNRTKVFVNSFIPMTFLLLLETFRPYITIELSKSTYTSTFNSNSLTMISLLLHFFLPGSNIYQYHYKINK